MSKTVIIVRHGESVGNIGLRTDSTVTMPLSEKGMAQAESLVELLPAADAVIVSSYIRTRLTAEPFLKKFPFIIPEEWHSVRELNFLSAVKHPGTTQAERIALRENFWQQLDPHFHDDETAESFSDFLNRGQETIEKLRSHKAETVIIFTHDLFIQLLNFIHDHKEFVEDNKHTAEGLQTIMKKFYETMITNDPIPNATPIDISYMIL